MNKSILTLSKELKQKIDPLLFNTLPEIFNTSSNIPLFIDRGNILPNHNCISLRRHPVDPYAQEPSAYFFYIHSSSSKTYAKIPIPEIPELSWLFETFTKTAQQEIINKILMQEIIQSKFNIISNQNDSEADEEEKYLGKKKYQLSLKSVNNSPVINLEIFPYNKNYSNGFIKINLNLEQKKYTGYYPKSQINQNKILFKNITAMLSDLNFLETDTNKVNEQIQYFTKEADMVIKKLEEVTNYFLTNDASFKSNYSLFLLQNQLILNNLKTIKSKL